MRTTLYDINKKTKPLLFFTCSLFVKDHRFVAFCMYSSIMFDLDVIHSPSFMAFSYLTDWICCCTDLQKSNGRINDLLLTSNKCRILMLNKYLFSYKSCLLILDMITVFHQKLSSSIFASFIKSTDFRRKKYQNLTKTCLTSCFQKKCKFLVKVRSHLLLFGKFLQAKSSHFTRNPHDWEFRKKARAFPRLISQWIHSVD